MELTLLLSNVVTILGDRPMRLELNEGKWEFTWIRRDRAIVGASCWYPPTYKDTLEEVLEHVLLVEELNTPRPAHA
jgi:hypothetical protein